MSQIRKKGELRVFYIFENLNPLKVNAWLGKTAYSVGRIFTLLSSYQLYRDHVFSLAYHFFE
jgi:hypothetical protein